MGEKTDVKNASMMNQALITWRIDKMKAAFLPEERTDLIPTNRLGHGWSYQKLVNQQAIFRTACKDGRDLGYDTAAACMGAAADL